MDKRGPNLGQSAAIIRPATDTSFEARILQEVAPGSSIKDTGQQSQNYREDKKACSSGGFTHRKGQGQKDVSIILAAREN